MIKNLSHGKATNRHVEAEERARAYEVHCKKIGAVRSRITSNWSQREVDKLQPSLRNMKKEQKAIEKHSDIEKENFRLLQRFIEIANKPSAAGPGVEPKKQAAKPGAQPKAKMSVSRRKELERIERENAGLLKRITQQKSTINTRKMNDEHAEQQKIMKMRCEIARFNAGKQGMSKIVEDREGTDSHAQEDSDDFRFLDDYLDENIADEYLRADNPAAHLVDRRLHFPSEQSHLILSDEDEYANEVFETEEMHDLSQRAAEHAGLADFPQSVGQPGDNWQEEVGDGANGEMKDFDTYMQDLGFPKNSAGEDDGMQDLPNNDAGLGEDPFMSDASAPGMSAESSSHDGVGQGLMHDGEPLDASSYENPPSVLPSHAPEIDQPAYNPPGASADEALRDRTLSQDALADVIDSNLQNLAFQMGGPQKMSSKVQKMRSNIPAPRGSISNLPQKYMQDQMPNPASNNSAHSSVARATRNHNHSQHAAQLGSRNIAHEGTANHPATGKIYNQKLSAAAQVASASANSAAGAGGRGAYGQQRVTGSKNKSGGAEEDFGYVQKGFGGSAKLVSGMNGPGIKKFGGGKGAGLKAPSYGAAYQKPAPAAVDKDQAQKLVQDAIAQRRGGKDGIGNKFQAGPGSIAMKNNANVASTQQSSASPASETEDGIPKVGSNGNNEVRKDAVGRHYDLRPAHEKKTFKAISVGNMSAFIEKQKQKAREEAPGFVSSLNPQPVDENHNSSNSQAAAQEQTASISGPEESAEGAHSNDDTILGSAPLGMGTDVAGSENAALRAEYYLHSGTAAVKQELASKNEQHRNAALELAELTKQMNSLMESNSLANNMNPADAAQSRTAGEQAQDAGGDPGQDLILSSPHKKLLNTKAMDRRVDDIIQRMTGAERIAANPDTTSTNLSNADVTERLKQRLLDPQPQVNSQPTQDFADSPLLAEFEDGKQPLVISASERVILQQTEAEFFGVSSLDQEVSVPPVFQEPAVTSTVEDVACSVEVKRAKLSNIMRNLEESGTTSDFTSFKKETDALLNKSASLLGGKSLPEVEIDGEALDGEADINVDTNSFPPLTEDSDKMLSKNELSKDQHAIEASTVPVEENSLVLPAASAATVERKRKLFRDDEEDTIFDPSEFGGGAGGVSTTTIGDEGISSTGREDDQYFPSHSESEAPNISNPGRLVAFGGASSANDGNVSHTVPSNLEDLEKQLALAEQMMLEQNEIIAGRLSSSSASAGGDGIGADSMRSSVDVDVMAEKTEQPLLNQTYGSDDFEQEEE